MAIAIEGYSVVGLRTRIDDQYTGGIEALSSKVRNSTELKDDDLWRCSFMALEEAEQFLSLMSNGGLQVETGPDPDAVIVNEFDRSVAPYCEWLQVAQWEKGVIAWLEGTDPETLIAREGWTPEAGSGLSFANIDDFEFVRLDDNVEVYRDRKTGKEHYVGRTKPGPEAVFKVASKIIVENSVHPGQRPLTGKAEKDVRKAIKDLEGLTEEYPDQWRTHWCIGKGRQAVGDIEGSYEAFKEAWRLDQEAESIPRELSGACLELGRADEAVEVGQKAAALKPDNSESLGNLACAYLVAARLDEASTTISAALKLAPDDSVNRSLKQVIENVKSGAIPQPSRLSDLTRPRKTGSKRQPGQSIWSRLKFWK